MRRTNLDKAEAHRKHAVYALAVLVKARRESYRVAERAAPQRCLANPRAEVNLVELHNPGPPPDPLLAPA